MVHRRGQTCWRSLLLAITGVVGAGTMPSAQGIGVQGGGSLDPSQVYVGAHFESGALIDRLHVRPNVEGGFGNGLTLASINVEFLYKFPLPGSRWTLYQGGGPSVNLSRSNDKVSAHGGTTLVVGFSHESGLFTEFKVGAIGSPNLKIGVGYTVRH